MIENGDNGMICGGGEVRGATQVVKEEKKKKEMYVCDHDKQDNTV